MTDTARTHPALLNGWRIAGWGSLAALLAIPAIAMQFSAEVNWGPGDFLVAAVLLGFLGMAVEGAMRMHGSAFMRAAVIGLAVLAFLAIWAELAVGIFD